MSQRILVRAVLLLSTGSLIAHADDTTANSSVPELAPLSTLAGSWEGEYVVGMNPKATDSQENQWILDGRFLRQSVTSTDSQGNIFKAMIVIGYEPNLRKYSRSFFFSSGGSFHETGDYDDATKTFTFTYADPAGASRKSTITVVDANTLRWTMTLRNQPGSTPLEISGTNHRKIKPEK